jgi:small subunit ribosomal protein S17
MENTVNTERNLRKSRVGIVLSDKMDKTVIVAVENKTKHPLYKKTVNKTSKFKAHDENGSCGIGDKVLIMETKKISKDKNWRVVEILEKAK